MQVESPFRALQGIGTSGDAYGLESSQRVIDTDSGWATTCKDCISLGTGPMLLQ